MKYKFLVTIVLSSVFSFQALSSDSVRTLQSLKQKSNYAIKGFLLAEGLNVISISDHQILECETVGLDCDKYILSNTYSHLTANKWIYVSNECRTMFEKTNSVWKITDVGCKDFNINRDVKVKSGSNQISVKDVKNMEGMYQLVELVEKGASKCDIFLEIDVLRSKDKQAVDKISVYRSELNKNQWYFATRFNIAATKGRKSRAMYGDMTSSLTKDGAKGVMTNNPSGIENDHFYRLKRVDLNTIVYSESEDAGTFFGDVLEIVAAGISKIDSRFSVERDSKTCTYQRID